MIAIFSNGVTFRIGSMVAREMAEKVKRLGTERESGGILIGTQSTDGLVYEVRDVTYPTTFDIRRPFEFVRSHLRANRAIDSAWRASSGMRNYLGEWHTHDEQSPRPSGIDRKLISDVVKDRIPPFDFVFMLIVGNGNEAFVGMACKDETGEFKEEVIVRWPE